MAGRGVMHDIHDARGLLFFSNFLFLILNDIEWRKGRKDRIMMS